MLSSKTIATTVTIEGGGDHNSFINTKSGEARYYFCYISFWFGLHIFFRVKICSKWKTYHGRPLPISLTKINNIVITITIPTQCQKQIAYISMNTFFFFFLKYRYLKGCSRSWHEAPWTSLFLRPQIFITNFLIGQA